VLFGLSFVFFERGFEVFRLRRLGHLGQGAQDFLFPKIDVLKGLVKQFLQFLSLAMLPLLGLGDTWQPHAGILVPQPSNNKTRGETSFGTLLAGLRCRGDKERRGVSCACYDGKERYHG
jgi:hypothetical protein